MFSLRTAILEQVLKIKYFLKHNILPVSCINAGYPGLVQLH